ncbi:MAG: RNA polymerase sigma-70 factor [Ekhidna sp.]|uniref:RNA polymerase sigma-70 factor n=1 Tax=Ekhidna sp. TaxID=2608089 RepID=UPI0032EBD3DC
MENEEVIVNRLINKDKRAFELVFNQYYGIMVLYASRFMDTKEEAEEITQDVFVKFWEKCDSLSEDSSIKSYLYRSIHNSCLNTLKHEKVKDGYRQHVIHVMESSYQNEFDERDPDELRNRINEEIDKLPPRCAEIFRLSRYEGLKYQEIADHLDISVKTVEVQMGKALKVLREALRDLKNLRDAS